MPCTPVIPLSERLARYIAPQIQEAQAYSTPSTPSTPEGKNQGIIKLDAMENPYSLPIPLQKELGERLGRLALNRYPGANWPALKHALITYMGGLDRGLDVLMGNGSDELIFLLSTLTMRPGAVVLAPVPTFVVYEMAARQSGQTFVGVDLQADWQWDLPALLAAIAQHQPALIYLAYPNNPTACLPSDEAVHAVLQAAPGLVVIDEAYGPFAERSFAAHLTRYPHLLLMRTLSKWGLAGVRLGYLVGHQAVIEQVNKVRPPYNISCLNAETALFALEHAPVFEEQARTTVQEREKLSQALGLLPGVQVVPSKANMILVRVPRADFTFEALKAQGLWIKNVSRMHPLLTNCLRITVGTAAENAGLLAALAISL
jgi:histidinol-phosphate aminotransferase